MDIRNIPLETLEGEETSLAAFGDNALLVVNVASKCGLTPQYETLEKLQREYGARGLTVVGFPSNQFLGQEPGTAAEIREFCSATYGVSFPMMAKTKVNGPAKHPLYKELTKVKDSHKLSGPVLWNFEKFVISSTGEVTRFRPTTQPDDPAVIDAIERGLPQRGASEGVDSETGAAA